MAERIMRDEDTALDVMAREELGIDPEGLGGSAAVAAVAIFVPFTFGAAVPVLPFAFLSGTAATVTARGRERVRAVRCSAPRSRCSRTAASSARAAGNSRSGSPPRPSRSRSAA